jgi:hypothetical protein
MEKNEALVEFTVKMMREDILIWEGKIMATGPQQAADMAAEHTGGKAEIAMVWHPHWPSTPFIISTV